MEINVSVPGLLNIEEGMTVETAEAVVVIKAAYVDTTGFCVVTIGVLVVIYCCDCCCDCGSCCC